MRKKLSEGLKAKVLAAIEKIKREHENEPRTEDLLTRLKEKAGSGSRSILEHNLQVGENPLDTSFGSAPHLDAENDDGDRFSENTT